MKNYHTEVFKGHKAGLEVTGIIDLKLSEKQLLALPVKELKEKIQKKNTLKMEFLQAIIFVFWIITTLFIFLFPFSLLPFLLLF